MPSRIDEIVSAITRLERELEQEMHGAREQWRYRVDAGRVRFQADVREAHRRLKNSIPRFLRDSYPLHILIAPVLYSLIVPIAILDLWTSAYQWVCFPVFRVPIVRRSSYVVIDRHHLSYLNPIEKMNCVYCGYANGVFAYVGRSPDGPNSTGARSSMRRECAERTGITVPSSTLATPTDTAAVFRCCEPNCGARSLRKRTISGRPAADATPLADISDNRQVP